MASGGGPEAPPPLPPEVAAFKALVSASGKRPVSGPQLKFVKKLDSIPKVALPEEEICRSALNLAENGLIGQFTGLWPSPRAVEEWVKRNWLPLVSEGIKIYFVGKGFFVFLFNKPEDRGLIFRNGPYFMGPQGLYLNKWSTDFDPAQDVPRAVPVWVRLPHLPLHCWNQGSLRSIGNALGKYIDQAPRKDQYSCARICVEVDLEIGLPEAIQLTVANWSHIQELDYEQLPFKCRFCHEYGHFARYCKKRSEETIDKEKEDQWKQAKKTSANRQSNKSKAKGPERKVDNGSTSNHNARSSEPKTNEGDKNPFEILASPPDPPEAEEKEPLQPATTEALDPGNTQSTYTGNISSPSYAEITKRKKNPIENIGSSDDETHEKVTKRAGRRTNKETREEESEKQKTLGSQATIEMTLGRTPRPRTSKGGGPTPSSGK
jgi:hypothetical protein